MKKHVYDLRNMICQVKEVILTFNSQDFTIYTQSRFIIALQILIFLLFYQLNVKFRNETKMSLSTAQSIDEKCLISFRSKVR